MYYFYFWLKNVIIFFVCFFSSSVFNGNPKKVLKWSKYMIDE